MHLGDCVHIIHVGHFHCCCRCNLALRISAPRNIYDWWRKKISITQLCLSFAWPYFYRMIWCSFTLFLNHSFILRSAIPRNLETKERIIIYLVVSSFLVRVSYHNNKNLGMHIRTGRFSRISSLSIRLSSHATGNKMYNFVNYNKTNYILFKPDFLGERPKCQWKLLNSLFLSYFYLVTMLKSRGKKRVCSQERSPR